MEFIPLKDAVEALLSGDRRRQRQIVDEICADDVCFSHIMGSVRGKEAFYGIYRLAATAWRYKITWIDYIKSDDKVVLQLDLGIKVPPFYLFRYHFPTIVLLRFRKEADGKLLLVEQVDHHSMLALMWVLGWPFTTISNQMVRPLQGFVFSRMGWAIDLLDDVRQLISTTLWNLLDGGPTTAVPGAAVPLSVPETTATLEDLRSAVAASLNLSGEDGKPRMLGSANGKKAA